MADLLILGFYNTDFISDFFLYRPGAYKETKVACINTWKVSLRICILIIISCQIGNISEGNNIIDISQVLIIVKNPYIQNTFKSPIYQILSFFVF